MGRGSRTGMKRSNRPFPMGSTESEDSDEDYVAEVDEQSDDLDSLVGADSAEENCFDKVVVEKHQDNDEDGTEGGWRTVVKPKPRARKGVSKARKKGVNGSNKRRKVIIDSGDSDNDDDDDDDDEFTPDVIESLEEEKEENDVFTPDVIESLDEEKEEEDDEFTPDIIECLEEEKEDDDEDGRDGEWRTVVKPETRARKGFSRSRKNGVNRSNKRRKVILDSDDGDDDEFTPDVIESLEKEQEDDGAEDGREGEWRTVVQPETRAHKGFSRFRKNGVNRPKKRRKVICDSDDDSDDDDDEEFTPDEFEHLEDDDDEDEEDDLEEEELFSLTKSKTRERVNTTLKWKTSVRTPRKRRSKTVRKPSKNKSKWTTNSRRKAKSVGDEEFPEKGPNLRGRTKGKPGRRRKRVTARSDSDICSDSSDCEFTISEEELEQVREASLICRTSPTKSRNSRQVQEDEAFCEPKTPLVRKGKEKAEEMKNDIGKPVCGICLTEEGKSSVRGTLNCCSHYFCFACIMEWSKVETRCPLCKQRFVTITKPTKCGKGFDLRNAVVTVPERDQVYQPSEEELYGFLNPYENVICTECHHGGDDALMLLCDVCDSPAHTYCVGLGREVPEGNWYCDGCRPAVLASTRTEFQDLMVNQRAGAGSSDGPSTYENMSEIDLNVTIPETQSSQSDVFLSSPRFSGGNLQLPSSVSGTGVSTVSGRRRLHHHIRYIFSNRLSQAGGQISSPGNITGLGANTTFHHSRTDVGTSRHAQQFSRFHENYPFSVQNTNFGPGRLGNLTAHVGQPLTAVDESSLGLRAWSGLDSINLEATHAQLSASGPLQPCNSRSSIGRDGGWFSSDYREEERTNFMKQAVCSTVRNQLKSISRDINLGHNIYMEISKRSEHTIMAAFGLESQRHDTFVVQPPCCIHLLDRLANVETSPVNDCCLECFQEFVKVILKRIMDIMMAPHWHDFRH